MRAVRFNIELLKSSYQYGDVHGSRTVVEALKRLCNRGYEISIVDESTARGAHRKKTELANFKTITALEQWVKHTFPLL